MKSVKVTARLVNELAGNPAQLDGLLVDTRCRFHESPPHERYDPPPPMSKMPPIPIHREWVGEWLIHRCSSPILGKVLSDRHERIAQHFPREFAHQLESKSRGVIATTNGAQKSMWLPVRKRVVEHVSWFAVCHGWPSELRRELKRSVTHIGQDRSRGNGRVAEWTVEEVAEDWSWFAPHPQGTVLMRQLPIGDYLPRDLVGYVRDYDAVACPYFHPGRKTECVRPC